MQSSTGLRPDRTDPRCGSLAGYEAHRRRGDHRCQACRAAASAYKLAARRERRPRRGDVDEVAVHRAVTGDPPAHMTVAERRLAVQKLCAAGLVGREVAERLRVTRRTVERHKRAA